MDLSTNQLSSAFGSLLPRSLSVQVRDFILRHVRLVPNDKIDTYAGVRATGSGYEIFLGKKYFELPDEVKKSAILHELAHIFRGDCLLFLKEEKLNRKAWNVAADSLINEGLPLEHVRVWPGVEYYGHIQPAFAERLPDQWLPPTRTIYDVILEAVEDFKNDMDQLMVPEGENGDLRKMHAKTVIEARKELSDDPEVKSILNGNMCSDIRSQGTRVVESVPTPIPLASILLRKLTGVRYGERELVRTYRRPGRVELLRGSARLPRLSILCPVDVSGSCTHLVPQFAGAGAWLGRRHAVEMCMFDTSVHPFSTTTQQGGGTAFRPVWEYAREKRVDAIVMLSDGEANDIKPHPRVPIIWVVPEQHNSELHLRPGMDSKLIIPDFGKGS